MRVKLLAAMLALSNCLIAENFKKDGVRYTIVSSQDKTVEVASSSQSAGSDGSVDYWDDVTIPETVTYNGSTYTVIGIGESAFVNCAGMTSISLPNTLTYIRKEAFSVCMSLQELTIPKNVTSIGYDILGVTLVNKVTVEGTTPASCDYNAFQYVQNYNNCVLYVPAGTKSKYQSASEWKKFSSIVEKGPEPGLLDGHEYVDLGLPSGNLWATMNYGASSASDGGSYLEWTEANSCASNWGGNWRTPSRTEMSELLNKCSWSWGSQNGKNGYIVTGTNGNSIFFPAAGFMMSMGGGAQSSGKQLYYWTSTSDGDGFSYALTGSSSSVNVSTTYNTELMMCSVRLCADRIQTEVKATAISLNTASVTLEIGQSYRLEAKVQPADVTDSSVSWQTSDPSVATISNGLVTAVSTGTAIITARTNDGSDLSASCTVKVNEPVVISSSVVLNRNYVELDEGGSITLMAEVSPQNVTDPSVIWSTTDASVAIVESGKVSAVGIGTARITATASDGSGASATCRISVSESMARQLVIELNDGRKVIYLLNGKPRISLKEARLSIEYQSLTDSFDQENVNKFYFQEASQSSIADVEDDHEIRIVYTNPDEIRIEGIDLCSRVMLFDLNGKCVALGVACADGGVSISLYDIAHGVYILKLPNHESIKILR